MTDLHTGTVQTPIHWYSLCYSLPNIPPTVGANGQAGEPVPSKEEWIKKLLAKPGDKATELGSGQAELDRWLGSGCLARIPTRGIMARSPGLVV